MTIEDEQQMAWNYLDLQPYIFAYDDAIIQRVVYFITSTKKHFNKVISVL